MLHVASPCARSVLGARIPSFDFDFPSDPMRCLLLFCYSHLIEGSTKTPRGRLAKQESYTLLLLHYTVNLGETSTPEKQVCELGLCFADIQQQWEPLPCSSSCLSSPTHLPAPSNPVPQEKSSAKLLPTSLNIIIPKTPTLLPCS